MEIKKMSTTTTPRKIPDEYDALIMKLTAKLKKDVGNEIAAFLKTISAPAMLT